MQAPKYFTLEEIKAFRVQLDSLYQQLNTGGTHEDVKIADWQLESMAMYQAIVKLIEAKMWLGKVCEAHGNPFPREFADKADVPENK